MLVLLLLSVVLLISPTASLAQGTWVSVELPESYLPLPQLNVVNPLAPTISAMTSSPNGDLAFFGKHKEKGTGSLWLFEEGQWRHIIDFGSQGVPAPQVLPFPKNTWPPVINQSSNGVYFLDGSKIDGKDYASILYFNLRGNIFREFGSYASEVIPFRYFAQDDQTDESFFLGEPTILSVDPRISPLRPYGIYRITSWNAGPFTEPTKLVVLGESDEAEFKLLGPLYAAGGNLIYWSGREVRGSILPRLDRFNVQTQEHETLLAVQSSIFGENVLAIHSAITDKLGNVYAAYSGTVTRIVVFPVGDAPQILHAFDRHMPVRWPPSVLLHDIQNDKLLFSIPKSGSGERDMLSELDVVTGSIRTILQFGDFVAGRAISTIGQFAAHYKGRSYIVQANGTQTDFGLLFFGKPAEPEPKPDPEPVPNLGPVKFHRQRSR